MDELLKKHRQEQRDLQGRITQKKKNATKKTRKGVNDECTELERQLKDRQENEVAELDPATAIPGGKLEEEEEQLVEAIDGAPNDVQNVSADSNEKAVPDTLDQREQGRKPSRQKARLARRAAEQEELANQAAEEASKLPDRRAEEQEVMGRELKSRGLLEHEVRSDGHCLYAAVADQLKQNDIAPEANGVLDYRGIRNDAAGFMETHPDDFSPFLEEPFKEYVVKVRDTAEWGGQLELTALARVYGITINVLQGDGRVESIDPGPLITNKAIWLAYYRHSFGLGEHYNSLRKRP